MGTVDNQPHSASFRAPFRLIISTAQRFATLHFNFPTSFTMIASIATRRTTLMAARRLASLLPTSTAAAAPLSTVASQQVYRIEDLLASMQWAHLKDNVEEVRQLLNEPKTNHSLHPESSLEDLVTRELRTIEDMVMTTSAPDLSAIESRVCGLKNHVRSQLYHLA